jgi:small subunit ribosomal protein S6
MPLYEHIFIARQDISPAQVEGLTETLQKVVAENGAKVAKAEYWGLRNLQYKIKKNRKGHYSLFNIEGPASAIHELERQEKINEDILRVLTIRVDELDETPSPVLSRRDRDGREGGREGGRDGGGRDRDGGGRDRDRDFGDRGDRGGDRDRGDRGRRF